MVCKKFAYSLKICNANLLSFAIAIPFKILLLNTITNVAVFNENGHVACIDGQNPE